MANAVGEKGFSKRNRVLTIVHLHEDFLMTSELWYGSKQIKKNNWEKHREIRGWKSIKGGNYASIYKTNKNSRSEQNARVMQCTTDLFSGGSGKGHRPGVRVH